MKNNKFFTVMLFGVVALSGISFKTYSMDRNALIATGIGTVALAGTYYITNTGTYKTWQRYREQKQQEKEAAQNPLLSAQPLYTEQGSTGNLDERVRAYTQQQEQMQKRSLEQQRLKSIDNPYWGKKRYIENYPYNK